MMNRLWFGIGVWLCLSFSIQAAVEIVPFGRDVFERLEEKPELHWTFRNHGRQAIAALRVSCAGVVTEKQWKLPAGMSRKFSAVMPGMLHPGKYTVELEFVFENKSTEKGQGKFEVVSEWNPEAMPVVMWQDGDAAKLEKIGFTHQLCFQSLYYQGGKPGNAYDNLKVLDENLRHNLRSIDLIKNQLCKPHLTKYSQTNRRGVPYPRVGLDVTLEEFRKNAVNDLENAVRSYGFHPGLTMVLCNSEIRDASQPSFRGQMEKNYLASANAPVPAEVRDRKAPSEGEIPDFPVLKNISLDNPLYRFYRWWWQEGDGWNGFHRLCRDTYRKALGKRAGEVEFFYDPAVRTPPIPGSGAGLDMLNQWSYSYHNPIKLATAVDELRTMARLNGGQKLMKTTQAIWYRSPPAPADKKVDNPPAWAAKYPNAKDAPYISIAPDHLLESFWSKISRRLDAIAYHGYGSLVEHVDFKWNQYRFTNPHSRDVLHDLIQDVVRPLGPVLKSVPERQATAAVLYTEGSNLFGTTGSWGWGWGSDAEMHQILQRCHLDPEIIFDEDMRQGRWKNLKILALPNCAILEQGVIEAVHEFQNLGGIVIGDMDLNPLILPDAVIDFRTGKTQEEYAGKLLEELGRYAQRDFYSDSVETSTHRRSWKNADYLFVVNDRRGFGDYVGMYGNVKEKGLPLACRLALRRNDIAVIYDLVARREIPFSSENGECGFAVDFTTSDGRLYLAMPRRISKIEASASCENGMLKLRVRVLDEALEPVEAILPIQVEIRDARGSSVVGSDYYAITDGSKELTIRPSRNDAFGPWKISVKELASNQAADVVCVVTE